MSAVQERTELLSAAASWISSDLHFQAASPGPNDDAEMELRDEELAAAARKFVAALERPAMNGDALYAWQELTPEGWGTIHCQVPFLGVQGNLIARDEMVARMAFGTLAHGHVAASGNPLRLARFELAEVLS